MKKNSCFIERCNIVLFVLCIVLATITCSLMVAMTQAPGSDLLCHTAEAENVGSLPIEIWSRNTAHPLWHFCVLFLHSLGVPMVYAAVSINVVIKVVAMLLVYWYYQRLLKDFIHPALIAVLSFISVLVAAVRIPSINPNVYVYGGSPNPWQNPTQYMVTIFMLPCVFFLSHTYDTQIENQLSCTLSWKQVVAFSLLLVLSLLAKPVFVQCFFPGAALYFLYQWIKHPNLTRYYVRLLISLIPTIPLILLQMNSYFGADSGSGVRAFIEIPHLKTELRAAFLINVFPIFVLFCTARKQKGSIIPIVVLTTLCACAENCFLGETGSRYADGNWGWGILAASLLLWIVSIPAYVKALCRNKDWKSILFGFVATILLLCHLASGVYYIHYLLTSGRWF